MKKIEKVFWVSDWGMGKILNNDPDTPRFNLEKEGYYVHRVTIIIEKEEKKIELTESQFDEMVRGAYASSNVIQFVKDRLFGGSND